VANDLDRFVRLCAPLTGFTVYDLHGTGMARLYYDTARRELGPEHLDSFLDVWEEAYGTGQGPVRLAAREKEIARALVYLWYSGAFPRIAPAVHAELRREGPNREFMASPTSYPEGLVWRAFGGHPPGAKPPGFGTWALGPPQLPSEAQIAEQIAEQIGGQIGGQTGEQEEAVAGQAPTRYDSVAYGAVEDDGDGVPVHLLPGARVSRSVSPSAVPAAAQRPGRRPVAEASTREGER
jgi:hypothetical protein